VLQGCTLYEYRSLYLFEVLEQRGKKTIVELYVKEENNESRKRIILLEGSHASPPCPSDKSSIKIKTLG
jgi:hypothetical protein